MRKIILLLLLTLTFSCKKEVSDFDAHEQMKQLKEENDSLKNILKSKYLFDNIHFKIIPSDETPEYNENEFKGKFVVVGYNKSDFLLLNGLYDYKSREFINCDTIHNKNGVYEFTLKNEEPNSKLFYIDLDETFGSKTHDSIINIPYKYLWKNK